MTLKHIEDKDDAENVEAARKAFNIDQAIAMGLMPPQFLKYIEYLEHEWSAQNQQSQRWLKKYLAQKDESEAQS